MALRKEVERHARFAVEDVHAQQRVALRLPHALRETADERLGHVAHGQLHDHFLDRVAHLGELRHADDLELQLLIVVGLGLHLPADEEEVVGEEVLAEILVVLAEKRELVRSVVVPPA